MKETINVPKSISWAINYILLIYFLFIAWFTVIKNDFNFINNGNTTVQKQNVIVGKIKKKDIDVDFYPNRFEESITFSMQIPDSSIFRFEIYYYTGYMVTVLTSGYIEDNMYKMIWEASELADGVYFFRAKSNGLAVDKRTINKL